MKALTAQTKQLRKVIALTHIFAVLSLTATVEGHEMNVKDIQSETYLELEQDSKPEQQYEPAIIELNCKQLIGEERRYKTDPRPQVECHSSVVGVFFWQLRNERGIWQNVYYNQQPTSLTGYMFSSNPGQIRVQFMDLDGNTSEYFITLDADYKPCIQSKGCLMV